MTKKRKGGGKNHSNKKKKKNKKKLSKEIKSHGKKFKEEQEWSAVSASSTVKEADFSLDQVTSHLCKQIPCVLNIHDEQLSLSLFEGMRRNDMDDIVSWFLRKEGFDSNEKQLSGPPKWNYTLGDYSDSFDYYAITGCPNCGVPYDLESPYGLQLNPPALTCFACGHRACQLHFRDESESILERLQQGLDASCNKFKESSSLFSDSAVYIRGVREQFNFGQKGKEWWQSRYLPSNTCNKLFSRHVSMVSMMSALKAPTIHEVCDICSNSTAYYTTFQARSADEGMTIMYECTRCHHRKTVNS